MFEIKAEKFKSPFKLKFNSELKKVKGEGLRRN